MGMKPIDMLGMRFGNLLVIERAKNRGTSAAWVCICDCGKRVIRSGGGLRLGQTFSCGCQRREKLISRNILNAKGTTINPCYEAWRSMIRRCYEPSHSSYKDYGSKGITVCARWRNSFLDFMSDMGERPKGFTIERNDSTGNYEPSNCHWASYKEQASNRSNVRLINVNGRNLTIPDACAKFGVNTGTAHGRLRRGWDLLSAVSTPSKWSI